MKHEDIYNLVFNLDKDETYHYRKKYINKTFSSLFDDKEALSNEKKKILGKKLYEYYSNPIEYRYNNIGYRNHRDIHKRNSGCIAIGDSFTEGEGIKYSDLWTSILETKITTPIHNFGICGTGPDTWFKLIIKNISNFDGEYIFLLSTYFPRYMFPGDGKFMKGVNKIFIENTEVFDLTRNSNFVLYNYQIKLLAMEAIANHHRKKLIVVNVHDTLDLPIDGYKFNIAFNKYEPARDCKHLGRDFHEVVANKFSLQVN